MLLHWSFGILQCLGLWQAANSKSTWRIFFYFIYTNFMVIFIYSCVLFELIALIGSFNNPELFINNLIVLLTMIGVCGKIANVIVKQKEIDQLIEILGSYPCCYQNEKEKVIEKNFDETIKSRTIAYLTMTESAVVMVVSVSILCDTPHRALPFDIWLPYDYKMSKIGYWIAYSHQIFAHIFGALVNVAYDTMIPGFMLKICAQLTILEHRVDLLTKNNNLFKSLNAKKQEEMNEISKCVQHHLKILQLAEITNKAFSTVTFLQFSISSIVICVTVYGLSQITIDNPEFAPTAFYFICMLTQIFVICFASTECNLKSSELTAAIYQSNWYDLNVDNQKSLLLIMMRSQKTLKFIAGHFVDVSLNSYNQLVKLSYSAYNVLQ